jgi:hypothetical protein
MMIKGFVRQYFSARYVINRLKLEFGHAVTIDILVKNEMGTTQAYKENIQRIDDPIPETMIKRRLNGCWTQ